MKKVYILMEYEYGQGGYVIAVYEDKGEALKEKDRLQKECGNSVDFFEVEGFEVIPKKQ